MFQIQCRLTRLERLNVSTRNAIRVCFNVMTIQLLSLCDAFLSTSATENSQAQFAPKAFISCYSAVNILKKSRDFNRANIIRIACYDQLQDHKRKIFADKAVLFLELRKRLSVISKISCGHSAVYVLLYTVANSG